MIKKLSKESQIGVGGVSASKKHLHKDCQIHWHEFYEIEYVLDGKGTCTVNGQTYEMKRGVLFFMNPVDLHSVKTDNATVINIMFSADVPSPDSLSFYSSPDVPKTVEISNDEIPFVESVLSEIVKSQKNEKLCSLLISVLLTKLSGLFIKNKDSSYHTLSQKMCFFIINHFREKITLADVAKAAGITPVYASKIFKAQTKIGFKEYLSGLRFEYAKKLLTESKLTVQQICYDCGFDDYPNFIRRFKAKFGLSPTKFRAINKNDCN